MPSVARDTLTLARQTVGVVTGDVSSGSIRRAGWLWFVAWVLVGALFALGLLALLSIGLLLWLLGVAGMVLLSRRPPASRGLPGAIVGVGIVALFIAYRNRGGPGDVCNSLDHGGTSCAQEWNPWPWLAAGVPLVMIGTIWFTTRNRGTTSP